MMKRRGLVLAAIAAALFAAAGPDAHAAIGDFTFTTTVAPTNVTPAGTGITLTLTPLNSAATLNALGTGTDIRYGNIAVSSTSTTTQSIGSVPYTFTLTITDTTSGQTGEVTVMGTLTGTASSAQANIANVFLPPLTRGTTPANLGGLFYTLTVGGDGSYTRPSIGTPGSFGGTVVAAVPEPASVTLLGMGCVGLVGLYFRRKLRA